MCLDDNNIVEVQCCSPTIYYYQTTSNRTVSGIRIDTGTHAVSFGYELGYFIVYGTSDGMVLCSMTSTAFQFLRMRVFPNELNEVRYV